MLEVRPFEIAVAGEVAYRDDDREKSLAFRLFRDGVRRLAISRDATWDELQQFLVIAALRLTGVRQQEEDAVTLFRNAAFTGIAIRAVEGFAAAEEAPELGDDDALGRASRFRPPGAGTPRSRSCRSPSFPPDPVRRQGRREGARRSRHNAGA